MPKNIVVISQKGGVGKTLAADEIAFSLDRTGVSYAFYDLDGQDVAVHVGHADPDPVVNIVDTPGRLEADTVKALAAADVVVVPTRPTGVDMKPLVTTLSVVRSQTDAPIVLVLNCMNRFSLATQIADWVEEACADGTMPACAHVARIPQTEMLSQAQALGRSIVDYKRTSPAAAAVMDMVDAVRRLAGLPEERGAVQYKELADNGRRSV